MIEITDKGAEKVHEFLASQQADISVAGLRVGVRGGGCSGFQYQLAFDEQRVGPGGRRVAGPDAVVPEEGAAHAVGTRMSLPVVRRPSSAS